MKNNSPTLKETFLKALECYKNKNLKEAEIICYKIINIDSNNFEATALLATISAANKNFAEAKKLLIKALDIKPKDLSILNNLGSVCRETGNLEDAVSYYKKAIQIEPDNPNANYSIGLTYHKLKELKKGKEHLERATKTKLDFALAFVALANIQVDLKEYDNAVKNYKKAIEINPRMLSAYNNLGLVYRILNDFKNAINSYESVLKINPKYVRSHHNLGMAFKEMGNFEGAIKAHKNAIICEPENMLNYFYLSELKKDILDSKLKKKVEEILKRSKTKLNSAYGNYLLARYENKQKNYEKELNYLKIAHNYFFESNKKKFDLGVKYCFDDVLKISQEANIKTSTKNKIDIKPIFIVGVPRCGSTLVEKIIGSGMKSIPMGEETAVFENFINKKILDKQSLDLGDATNIRDELNDIYKKKGLLLKEFDFTFTDKSLNNFFYLRLIKEVYPNAKIINCQRDVFSSILSIYQNNLTELAWAHNLENIFKYFDNYFKTIKEYNSQYPNTIYNLKLESLINNPEKESKNILEYCGLPWDKRCLEYYKRKDIISKTTSNVTIRESINKNSLNKYLPYKKFLSKYSEEYSWYS